MGLMGLRPDERVGNLSAGQVRRLQIVAALATQPDLVIGDEITAVLDILGRRRFLGFLKERQRARGLTVVLATNVPEGLDLYADHVLLLHHGRPVAFSGIADFTRAEPDLAGAVVRRLEAE